MVEIDAEFERVRDRGEMSNSQRKQSTFHSRLTEQQNRRVARRETPEPIQTSAYTRWAKT